MRKLAAVALPLVAALLLVGCGGGQKSLSMTDEVKRDCHYASVTMEKEMRTDAQTGQQYQVWHSENGNPAFALYYSETGFGDVVCDTDVGIPSPELMQYMCAHPDPNITPWMRHLLEVHQCGKS